MASPESPGSTPESGLDAAIAARLESIESGNYRANTELILRGFADYLREFRSITDLEDVDVIDCRRYAQWLRSRVRDDSDGLSAASAHANGPYFTVVRAFLSWCVDDERLDTNPARPNRVKDALPEYHGGHERQYWPRETREALVEFVDTRARKSLECNDIDQQQAYRDRALVMMLALTGARGAELFSDPRDPERNGLTWGGIDLDDGVATVLGKKREEELIPLTNRVAERLSRYKDVQKPASEDWPVFPTQHRPTMSQQVYDELGDLGWDETEISTAVNSSSLLGVFRTYDLTPPAISKNGARSVMKRISSDAGLEVEGEYLKPHGGRRGFGSELYASDPELAQELLRHVSIETTHESYREKQVSEQRSRLEDILEE